MSQNQLRPDIVAARTLQARIAAIIAQVNRGDVPGARGLASALLWRSGDDLTALPVHILGQVHDLVDAADDALSAGKDELARTALHQAAATVMEFEAELSPSSEPRV